jgi:hypothetical protein
MDNADTGLGRCAESIRDSLWRPCAAMNRPITQKSLQALAFLNSIRSLMMVELRSESIVGHSLLLMSIQDGEHCVPSLIVPIDGSKSK